MDISGKFINTFLYYSLTNCVFELYLFAGYAKLPILLRLISWLMTTC